MRNRHFCPFPPPGRERSGPANASAAAAGRAGRAAGAALPCPLLSSSRLATVGPEPPPEPCSLPRSGRDRAAHPRPLLSRRSAGATISCRGPPPRGEEASRAQFRPYLSGWRRLLLPGEALAHPPAPAGRGRGDAADTGSAPGPTVAPAANPAPRPGGGASCRARAVPPPLGTCWAARGRVTAAASGSCGPSPIRVLPVARERGGAWLPCGP